MRFNTLHVHEHTHITQRYHMMLEEAQVPFRMDLHCKAGVSNSNTQWAKIKSVLVEGRTGSMFIAKRIEMNLLHILTLELTKLK